MRSVVATANALGVPRIDEGQPVRRLRQQPARARLAGIAHGVCDASLRLDEVQVATKRVASSHGRGLGAAREEIARAPKLEAMA